MSPLDRFHEAWPRGVAPSLVEHFAGAADHVAPAMTLWSGAERFASMLATAGVAPGDRLSCSHAPGIRWAQALVGCLMRGVVFCPNAPGAPARAEARAHLDALGALSVSKERPQRVAGPAALTFADGVTWSHDTLEGLSGSDLPSPRVGARMCSEAPWWEPAGVATLWLGLTAGVEFHVGLTDEAVHRLGPEVVTCRPGRLSSLLDWVPVAPKGVAVIGGLPTAEDQRAAEQKGWQLASFRLPG